MSAQLLTTSLPPIPAAFPTTLHSLQVILTSSINHCTSCIINKHTWPELARLTVCCRVLERYPHNGKLLRCYGKFLEDIFNDPSAAARVYMEAARNGGGDGLLSLDLQVGARQWGMDKVLGGVVPGTVKTTILSFLSVLLNVFHVAFCCVSI